MTDILNFLYEPPKKKKILISLSGVLAEYDKYYDIKNIGRLRDGAEEFLKDLSKKYEIKILTTRNKLEVADWIFQQGLERYVSDITDKKEKGTYLIIDKHCIRFENDFNKLETCIKNFKQV